MRVPGMILSSSRCSRLTISAEVSVDGLSRVSLQEKNRDQPGPSPYDFITLLPCRKLLTLVSSKHLGVPLVTLISSGLLLTLYELGKQYESAVSACSKRVSKFRASPLLTPRCAASGMSGRGTTLPTGTALPGLPSCTRWHRSSKNR